MGESASVAGHVNRTTPEPDPHVATVTDGTYGTVWYGIVCLLSLTHRNKREGDWNSVFQPFYALIRDRRQIVQTLERNRTALTHFAQRASLREEMLLARLI